MSAKTKVIVITVERYSEKTLRKNMKDEFMQAGYEFEYWYIGNLKTYFGHIKSEVIKSPKDDFKYFKGMDEVINALSKENAGFVAIIQFPININTKELIRLVTAKAKTILNIDLNASLSSFGYFYDAKSYYLSLLKNPRKLIFNLRNKFAVRRLSTEGVMDNIVKFQTGAKFSDDKSITFDDVYTYLKVNSEPNFINKEYVVFIDVSLPNHIDFQNHGVQTLPINVYYNKINKFLEKVENLYKSEVIIAAHPKSNHMNEYGDRRVIYGKTAELIKNCKFVINHYSSTVSFATLWKKPILFIYMNEFLDKNGVLFKIYKRILYQSTYLDMKSINIDEFNIDEELINEVDKFKYQNFVTDYLLSAQYPKTNYEIIKKYI